MFFFHPREKVGTAALEYRNNNLIIIYHDIYQMFLNLYFGLGFNLLGSAPCCEIVNALPIVVGRHCCAVVIHSVM